MIILPVPQSNKPLIYPTSAEVVSAGIVATLNDSDPVAVNLQGQSPPHDAVVVDL